VVLVMASVGIMPYRPQAKSDILRG
jgi:hypothetical protein